MYRRLVQSIHKDVEIPNYCGHWTWSEGSDDLRQRSGSAAFIESLEDVIEARSRLSYSWIGRSTPASLPSSTVLGRSESDWEMYSIAADA